MAQCLECGWSPPKAPGLTGRPPTPRALADYGMRQSFRSEPASAAEAGLILRHKMLKFVPVQQQFGYEPF